MQAVRHRALRAVSNAGLRIEYRRHFPAMVALDRCTFRCIPRRSFSSETPKEDKAKDAEASNESTPAQETAEEAEAPETVEAPSVALEKELATLQEKVRARKHELLLSLADFENNKKRFSKEREDRRKSSMANFATEMIKVYSQFDVFAGEKHTGAVQALHQGVALTRDLYKASFERFGVRNIQVEIGEPFVPARHENVGTVESTKLPMNAVGEIVRPGWILEPDSPKPVVLQKVEVHVSTQGPKVPAS
ncbi:grpE [Symbiodinium natans]|uniref:GrpE protein n=1 Tax=Symbiodinium natans TaxID=878477 RepID=A0A812P5W0_9DINO|nr:grpE [Symbiodinium natans]